MQFLRQDETLSLSFASLVMVDYTYKYYIKGFFILSSQTWAMKSKDEIVIEFLEGVKNSF